MIEIHRTVEIVMWGVVLSVALSLCCTRLYCHWRAYREHADYRVLMGKYGKWQVFHAVCLMAGWLVLLL